MPRIQPRGDQVVERRDSLCESLKYIDNAPLPYLREVLDRYAPVDGGPSKQCSLYRLRSGTASKEAIERQKIRKCIPPHAPYSAHDGSKSMVVFIVLKVHKPDLFQRLYQWAKREIASSDPETWVVGHSCHQGHDCCYNPAHLFLTTNSINMRQRSCAVLGASCAACGYVPACTCGSIVNCAMVDGRVPPCVRPLAIVPQGLNDQAAEIARLRQQIRDQAEQIQLLSARFNSQRCSDNEVEIQAD